MKEVLQAILFSYPMFDSVLEGIDKLVYYKALTSYADCNKTQKQIDKILQLQNQADRIRYLKELTNGLMKGLSDEERQLVEYKYFRFKMPDGFDYTSRKYFRKQKKVGDKLLQRALAHSMDENWFVDNYSDIAFLNQKYVRLKAENKLAKGGNSAHNSNL